MNIKKKLAILISLFIVILVLGAYLNNKYNQKPENVISSSPKISSEASPSPLNSPEASSLPSPTPPPLPDSYLIDNFSFQSQAPYANWDELHDEACEEAALILVNYYLNNQSLSAGEMEDQIQKMVAWEIENFGSHRDLTIAETAQMAKGFYSITDWEIRNDIAIDDIKAEVSQGHPVIVPTAGRMLGNPYFRSPGPVYHMLVVIGYKENIIIVQDIGTKRGDHYEYSEKILYNAIHDWAGAPDNIEAGPKNMLVFR